MTLTYEGHTFPIADLCFEEELTLVPRGISFDVYPVKKLKNFDENDFKIVTSMCNDLAALLSRECGLLKLTWCLGDGWQSKPEEEFGAPTLIISAIYPNKEAAEAACPTVDKIVADSQFKEIMMELHKDHHSERFVGEGFLVKCR